MEGVDIGVGEAEMGVSGAGGVTFPNPALASSSVMVCSPTSPSLLDLSITSLQRIVTKCLSDS